MARRTDFLKPTLLLALILALAVFIIPVNAQSGLAFISPPGDIKPYSPASLTLSVPEAGLLRVFAQIGREKIPLFLEQRVDAGELSLPFEGLSAAGEPLCRGDALMIAELSGENQTYQAEHPLRVLKPAPAVMYAIVARETLCAQGGDDLIVDYQLTSARPLFVTICRADKPDSPVRSWTLEPKDELPRRFRWDKTAGRQPAAPGDYVITFSLKNSPQPAISRAFSLTAEQPPAPQLVPAAPGEFLPQAMDDASVWRAMMAPLAALDIGDMQHQSVYTQPSESSEVLGKVHGQTAGLEVLETGVNGFTRVRTARHDDGAIITGYVPEKKLMVIRPDDRFGILIDKKSQSLRLYEAGAYIGSLPVSTGVYVPPGKDSFETISGAFITQDRIATFRQEGFQYDYAMRIDGGNLLHQLGYRNKGGQDFSEHQAALGKKGSHGCVRIDNRINDQGINAWWLYANLPRGTKVLVVEDASLIGETVEASAAPVSTPLPSPSPIPAPKPKATPAAALNIPAHDVAITLSFTGDCVLGSEESTRKQPDSFDSIVAEKGFDWPFSGFADYFSHDDLTLINLENVLMNSSRDKNPKRLHNFRGPTDFAQILKLGSVELVNIANNHYPDYGAAGKKSTRNALEAVGIPYAGYNWLHVFEKQGIRVGFGGIRETIYHQDKDRIRREVAELKADGCHYVVYTMHAGEEYAPEHNAMQTEIAHAAIDAGANLVIGHHPHVPQGIEMYNDGLIFYSLGNFIFGGNLALSTFDALAAQVTLYYQENALVNTQVCLIPVITSGIIPANDFRPIPAAGEDKQRILNTVNADSDRVYPESFSLPGL
ncbi:MAG: CapA family protein [Christensenellales bacterium]